MKKRSYINQADKNLVLSILAAVTTMEIADDNHLFLESRKKVRTVRTLLKQIGEEVLGRIPQKQVGQMLNIVNDGMTIEIKYYDPKKEYVRVPREAVERITRSSLSDCGACFPDKEKADQCQLLEDLLALGVDPRSDGVCPYAIL